MAKAPRKIMDIGLEFLIVVSNLKPRILNDIENLIGPVILYNALRGCIYSELVFIMNTKPKSRRRRMKELGNSNICKPTVLHADFAESNSDEATGPSESGRLITPPPFFSLRFSLVVPSEVSCGRVYSKAPSAVYGVFGHKSTLPGRGGATIPCLPPSPLKTPCPSL